ncbi:hypothetical protein [Duganella vulcania]|uniref:XRE family transcriptional regulator n=1 Tax=Duganella vulcania TaxID=2692166 RepID=A0A845GG24_9BURK|nr:hypothetical protein [Duganella vulcania]MYM92352.1 hypothetical protein [Duganella vulcania]
MPKDFHHDLSYDPNRFVDLLLEKMSLKNDAALCRVLEVAPPIVSKVRHRRLPVGAALLIRIHEESDIPLRDLRLMLGDRRSKQRLSNGPNKAVAARAA